MNKKLIELELIKNSPDAQAKFLFPIKPWIVIGLGIITSGIGAVGYIGWQLWQRHKYVKEIKKQKQIQQTNELLVAIENYDKYEKEKLLREIEKATKQA